MWTAGVMVVLSKSNQLMHSGHHAISSHLMSVDSMGEEEVLDLLRNLVQSVIDVSGRAHFARRQERPPLLHKLAEHTVWSTLLHLSQATED